MEPTHPDRLVENVTAPSAGGFPIRMGRYPAEIAEGAEVYWEGGKGPTSEPFSTTGLVN